jgi:hypothetical protein
MAELVIDEWLWSDLVRHNGLEPQREAFNFLRAVFNKCDRIVIVKGSRFDEKAGLLWQHDDVPQRTIARYYQNTFVYNSNKSMLLEESELAELTPEIASDVKPADQYLIRAQQTAQAELVVTTDNPLMRALEKHGIPHQARETFVPGYISKYG